MSSRSSWIYGYAPRPDRIPARSAYAWRRLNDTTARSDNAAFGHSLAVRRDILAAW